MSDGKQSQQKEALNWKLPAKENEYTCGNNISRIYSENLWKLWMNQSRKLLLIN